MLAQGLESPQHTVVSLKQETRPDSGLVSSVTQEQLQDVFINGNTHNVKLMEAGNGDTFVIDEQSQQILTRFNSEPQGKNSIVEIDNNKFVKYCHKAQKWSYFHKFLKLVGSVIVSGRPAK